MYQNSILMLAGLLATALLLLVIARTRWSRLFHGRRSRRTVILICRHAERTNPRAR